MNALMSFQLQFSFLTARNIVQPRLLTEGTEEFLFVVTHKCAYLCLMKCNLSLVRLLDHLAQLGKHAAQATHFNGVLTSSYS